MAKEYQTFVAALENVPDGREVELVIKDLTPGPRKYNSYRVKAIVNKSKGGSPDADILWVRSEVGALYPDRWSIKVLTVLSGPIPAPPYSGYKL